jgi:hypothetical protein
MFGHKMLPTRLTNQSGIGFWDLFAKWPWGTLAGAVVLLIGALILWAVLGALASAFGFVALLLGTFFFLVAWIMWGTMDAATRAGWGKFIWLIPLGIWIGGAIGKATGLTNSLEFAFGQANARPVLDIMGQEVKLSLLLIFFMFLAVGITAYMLRED